MSVAFKRKVMGLVLAGGKSSRMQRPKAHLVIHGVPQWRHCQGILREVCDEVYFSVSPQLKPPLDTDNENLIDDVFREPIGPLGGIISAFHRFPDHALFVLACDLPYFGKDAARYLVERRKPDKNATVFVANDRIEPLCAMYEPSIKHELARAWADNRLCPRAILSHLDIETIEVPTLQWLINLNHAQQLDALCPRQEHEVHVHYYAALREATECSTETVNTTSQTVGELFLELRDRYGFTTDYEVVRFAVNDQLVMNNAPITHNDSVVFIPPVSGG